MENESDLMKKESPASEIDEKDKILEPNDNKNSSDTEILRQILKELEKQGKSNIINITYVEDGIIIGIVAIAIGISLNYGNTCVALIILILGVICIIGWSLFNIRRNLT